VVSASPSGDSGLGAELMGRGEEISVIEGVSVLSSSGSGLTSAVGSIASAELKPFDSASR
jgi:hypothetical protein